VRADGELAGTVDYGQGWLVLAVCLLAAVLVWNGAILVWGRPRLVQQRRPTPTDPARLSARYLALIDQIEGACAQGEVDPREAHRRLSCVTREFVQERTGVGVTSMTLTDLRRSQLPDLVQLVELVYPPEFEPSTERPAGELDRALAQARQVVTRPWT